MIAWAVFLKDADRNSNVHSCSSMIFINYRLYPAHSNDLILHFSLPWSVAFQISKNLLINLNKR